MEKNCNENTPICPILAEMQIGDVVFYPVSRYRSVKTTSSVYGLEQDRYYKCHIMRDKRLVSVERTR